MDVAPDRTGRASIHQQHLADPLRPIGGLACDPTGCRLSPRADKSSEDVVDGENNTQAERYTPAVRTEAASRRSWATNQGVARLLPSPGRTNGQRAGEAASQRVEPHGLLTARPPASSGAVNSMPAKSVRANRGPVLCVALFLIAPVFVSSCR